MILKFTLKKTQRSTHLSRSRGGEGRSWKAILTKTLQADIRKIPALHTQGKQRLALPLTSVSDLKPVPGTEYTKWNCSRKQITMFYVVKRKDVHTQNAGKSHSKGGSIFPSPGICCSRADVGPLPRMPQGSLGDQTDQSIYTTERGKYSHQSIPHRGQTLIPHQYRAAWYQNPNYYQSKCYFSVKKWKL